MEKNKNQSGGIHIIITFLLVLLLLGSLGFTFWQNFLRSKIGEIGGKTLTIKEWGVTGTYSGATDLKYTIEEDVSTQGIMTGDNLSFAYDGGNNCDTVHIYRYNGDEVYMSSSADVAGAYKNRMINSDIPTIKKIGNYYYEFKNLSSTVIASTWIACGSENDPSLVVKQADLLKSSREFFQSLKVE